MSIDVSQFHQVFFEESFEGLESMESALLELSQGVDDPELIHLIFRAAHSIKGGSGTFGFTVIADFTHLMETLLDEMRDGQRQVTIESINLLLESGDVLRGMLESARDNKEYDSVRIKSTQLKLQNLLAATGKVAETQVESTGSPKGWQIQFKPFPDLLKTGNDPVRMLHELSLLGTLNVGVQTDKIPQFDEFDPEEIYLSWNMVLTGEVSLGQVKEIFEWVEGDCELGILPLQQTESRVKNPDPVKDPGPVASASVETKAEATPEAQPVAVDRRVGDRRSHEDRRVVDRRSSASSDSSIRVNIKKIDELINMVGELVIIQSMLGQVGGEMEELEPSKLEKLRDGLGQLERNTRELQESVMRIRMLPISFSFKRFPRLVHDLSAKLGKKVELKISGESTELDKTVMEKIGDPLVHLVRNSLDHGIEMPDVRVKNGKSEVGTVHLNAYHQGGNIVIEISDDGAGLSSEKILSKAKQRNLIAEGEKISREKILDLIFEPGFSTAEEVSDVSGRGVGMDVVRRNIKDLSGTIEVQSEPGQGAIFTIRLPLTLAILDGQLIRVGEEIFIIPLVSIVESLLLDTKQVNSVAGSTEMYKLRDEYILIVRLYDLFGIKPKNINLQDSLLVVVEHDGQKIGLLVDELLGQQQVVIKSLETNFRRVDGLSGATILGDGTVALILDVGGLITMTDSSSPLSLTLKNKQAA